MKRNTAKALVSWYYAKIFFFFLVGIASLASIAGYILHHHFKAGGSSWLPLAMAVLGVFLAFFAEKRQIAKLRAIGALQRFDEETENRLYKIAKYISDRRNGFPIPAIRFLHFDSTHLPGNKDRAKMNRMLLSNAAMFDAVYGRDVLIVGHHLEQSLNDHELTGVIAHEMRHQNAIENILSKMTRAVTFTLSYFALTVGVIYILKHLMLSGYSFWEGIFAMAAGLVLWFVAFIVAGLAQLAQSRATEMKTDLRAALDLDDPIGLARALHILHEMTHDPFAAFKEYTESRKKSMILATHPPLTYRIRVLEGLAE